MRNHAPSHRSLPIRIAGVAALVLALTAVAACGDVDSSAPDGEAAPPAEPGPASTDRPAPGEQTGVTGETTEPGDPLFQALAEAREQWARSGPESYQLFVTVGCNAPCASGPFLVTVAQGAVTDVVYSASGPEGEPPESASELTVDGLFALVEEALAGSASAVDVEYGATTGMPLNAFLEGVPEDAISYFEARLLEDVEDTELAAARDRWHALGLERYVIELRRGCFCPPEHVGPFRITVSGGTIESVVFAPGGPEGEPPAETTGALTVEDLFAAIEEAKARGAAEVRATYDPETGVPTDVYIDQIAEAVDEEISYEVRLLED